MRVLDKPLRNKLETAVKAARDIAEEGSRIALQALAVDASEPFAHLTPEDRDLRNRLRARAQQIGDQKVAGNGKHGISHLVQECSYEHWHRMLFARFLAENGLLMHPEGVAVTLKECEELAPEEDAENGWELAARYASKMLPQIFRPDAPVLQVKLPPEHQKKLEKLLDDLTVDTFKARDSLGWVYQFWQAKRKDEINASEVKIGADELPAVTQLFTEPYMVDFLLQNTLGAWWVGRHGKETLPVEMPYLRFLDDGRPAVGTFDGWPTRAAEITVLDPCCGSGHFLVAAFDILVRFRMVEEGLSADEAGDAVLRDNIHGLEIDERCTQIAAFALAFTSWQFTKGYRNLPELNLACSGLSINEKKETWISLSKNDRSLTYHLELLYDLFIEAPILGSLINPSRVLSKDSMFEIKWESISPFIKKALLFEEDYERKELGVAAKGIAKAADLLSGKYDLVITNVPYLKRGSHHLSISLLADKEYKDAKQDLGTIMISRWSESINPGGILAFVALQSILAKKGFTKFRHLLLQEFCWQLIARLGAGAFESISGEVVSVALYILCNSTPDPDSVIHVLDFTNSSSIEELKSALSNVDTLLTDEHRVQTANILKDPCCRIRLGASAIDESISNYSTAMHGQGVGDGIRFYRKFWELFRKNIDWEFYQLAPNKTSLFSGREEVVFWQREKGKMAELARSVRHLNHKAQQWRSGKPNWGKYGVVVSLVGDRRVTLYTGEIYGENCCVIIPNDISHLNALWSFIVSGLFAKELAKIDSGFAVSVKTMLAVPFNPADWTTKAVYLPDKSSQHSDDPTQWC